MKLKRLTEAMLLTGLVGLGMTAVMEAQAANAVPEQFIVKVKDSCKDSGIDAAGDLGATPIQVFPTIGAQLWIVPEDTKKGTRSVRERLDSFDCFEYYDPNYYIELDATPNDPSFTDHDKMWGLIKIEAEAAWDIQTGSTVPIAVIDTGIDYTHPDLIANMWVNPNEIPDNGIDDDENGCLDDVYGCNFTQQIKGNDGRTYFSGNPLDDHYHGTHVAGIIAATGNNGTGVVGVNWSAKLMAIKSVRHKGLGVTEATTADAIQAIEYAVTMGAKIINASWHIADNDKPLSLEEAIRIAGQNGVLVVVAAGNATEDIDARPQYPASYNLDNIITVAATDPNDGLFVISNYGKNNVDLGAPGIDIYSTVPLNYTPVAGQTPPQYISSGGTSMAVPYVVGVASLMWEKYPQFTYQEVKNKLLQSVDKVPALEGKTVSGGRLNARKALLGNEKPVAVCNVVYQEDAPLSVTLDGSGSYDGDGSIQSYQWNISEVQDDLSKGGVDSGIPLGKTLPITFKTPGTYAITLNVADNSGNTSGAECSVTVPFQDGTTACNEESESVRACITSTTTEGNVPLTVSLKGTLSVGQVIPAGESSVDAATSPIVMYLWEVSKCSDECVAVAYEKVDKLSYTFSEGGTYRVKLTVYDSNGGAGSNTMWVEAIDHSILPELGGYVPWFDDNGNLMTITTTNMWGGVSVGGKNYDSLVFVTLADSVNIVGKIVPAPEHIGQLVDIVVVAQYWMSFQEWLNDNPGQWFMLDSTGYPAAWDGDWINLVVFKPGVILEATNFLPLYTGQLLLPGTLEVQFGYHLNSLPNDSTGYVLSDRTILIDISVQ